MSSGILEDVFLEKHGFTFTVVKLPKSVIVDKLAIASPITGLISRTEYQSFVLSETVLNLERISMFMAENCASLEDYIELKDEIIELSYTVNPALDPDILAVTNVGVIKPSALCGEGCKPLTETRDWNKVPDSFNPYIGIDEEEIMGDIEEYSLDDSSQESFFSDLQAPPHVDTVKKVWQRTGLELEVKRYDPDDVYEILKPTRVFPDEDTVYKIFVAHQTVVNVEHLFLLIHSMSLTESVAFEIIVQELYEICIMVNPFLKLEDIDLNDLRTLKPTKVVDRKPNKGRTIRRAKRKAKGTDDGDVRLFSEVTKAELLTLADRVKAKVIGQEESIDKIIETIQIASCGLRDPEKPIAVYMLCGSTGVGKTLTAKVLAEELCGNRDAIVRVDCSEYQQPHDTQKLIGAPPSFVGHDDGGYLTNAVQKNPFSVVLFDEVEKAHSKFFDVLLQIMDDARLTDGKGIVHSFKDCVILLTSNVGVSETLAIKNTMGFGDAAEVTDDKQDKALTAALKKRFRPEFLNRVDSVVNFKSLDKDSSLLIAGLLLDKISSYMANKDIDASFSVSVLEMVHEKGFSKKYGARPLERTIDREVVKPLAKKILLDEIYDGCTIKVDYVDEEIIVNIVGEEIVKGSI